MGLGRFGGGVGVARFLAQQGARVTVTDRDSADDLAESVAAVGPCVTFHLGGHRREDFTDADLLVVNPAVRPDNEYLGLAREHGVPVETEMNLFFRLCPARILGVTGSVGKTTTASMIHRALDCRSSGQSDKSDGTDQSDRSDLSDQFPRVWLGGNIGRSLLLDLDKMTPGDLVVLEISSAQLERLRPAGFAPDVAVVTNVSQNHLDWHGTMDAYVGAKRHILASAAPGAAAVLNQDDPVVRAWSNGNASRTFFFSTREPVGQGVFLRGDMLVARLDGREQDLLDTRQMRLPGSHNVANAAAALAGCAAVGADLQEAASALLDFQGAEHRLEFVREHKGLRYYNDSKATTPASALAALRSFDRPVVLILGGRDKGMAFDELVREGSRCRAVVLVGELADPLDALFAREVRQPPRVKVLTVEAAVTAATLFARVGDIVLLSPAGTSFDLFKNFEERGRAFKNAVAQLAGSQQ